MVVRGWVGGGDAVSRSAMATMWGRKVCVCGRGGGVPGDGGPTLVGTGWELQAVAAVLPDAIASAIFATYTFTQHNSCWCVSGVNSVPKT